MFSLVDGFNTTFKVLSSAFLHQFTHLLGFMKSEFKNKKLIKIEEKTIKDRIKSSGSRLLIKT